MTDQHEEPLWYIEALDVLGGYAFASFRKGADTLWESPVVAISPPTFVAEPIASAATAVAATRGSFQRSLIIDGAGVPFAECSHVSEFVRRLFVAGSGSVGGGGGAAFPQETPVEPTSGSDQIPEGVRTLYKSIVEFDELCSTVTLNAKPFALPGRESVSVTDFADCLERAGKLLFETSSSVPTRTVRQCAALMNLDWATKVLGFPYLRSVSYPLAPVLYWWGVGPANMIDDVLIDMPIPNRIGEQVALPVESRTLFHLLSLGSAAPRIFLKADPDALILFMFAASLVVASSEASRQLSVPEWLWNLSPSNAEAVVRDRLDALYRTTTDWIRASFPRFAFGYKIEDLIQNAVQLRYESRHLATLA